MKKLLLLILFPFYAFSQNTVTYPAGTQQGTAVFRTYGTLTDSLSKRYFLQFAGGKGNEIYTATYISKYFIRFGHTLTNGYGIAGSPFDNTNSPTWRTDTTVIQTISNFFTKGNTKYAQLNTTNTFSQQQFFSSSIYIGVSRAVNFNYNGLYGSIYGGTITQARAYQLPDEDGVFAMTKDTSGTNGFQTISNFFPKGDTRYYTKTASDARYYPSGSNPLNYLVNPMTGLGDGIYGGASGAPARFAGNTSTTMKFLTQTGTGSAGAAPVYFDLFNTSNSWNQHQAFNAYIGMQGNSPILFYNTAGTFYTQINTNPTTTQNNLISFQNKGGVLAMTNDNVSQFTNDAGYLTGASGVTSITGTTNQIIRSSATGAVTLSLPQSIATTSNVTFNSITANGQASSFFKSLNIINTFGTPQSWGLVNDLTGTNDGKFGIVNVTSGITAFQIDKSNNAAFANSLSSFALMGNGTTPAVTVTPGGGAGTGATASIVGTITSGTVTFTVGTSPGIGSLFNITMPGGFTFTSSANGVAQLNSTSVAAIPVGASFTVNASGTVLQVQIAGAALTAGSTYKINYICIGY